MIEKNSFTVYPYRTFYAAAKGSGASNSVNMGEALQAKNPGHGIYIAIYVHTVHKSIYFLLLNRHCKYSRTDVRI